MTIKMILRGAALLEMSKAENTNQLALKARISPQTVYKYIGSPEEIQALDLSVLSKLLVDGVGLGVEEVKALRLGDIFDIVIE
jgi:hypothetical protein